MLRSSQSFSAALSHPNRFARIPSPANPEVLDATEVPLVTRNLRLSSRSRYQNTSARNGSPSRAPSADSKDPPATAPDPADWAHRFSRTTPERPAALA